MDVRQLQVFTAVAQELSFSRAADRLDSAQPAVSQTIRRLESELGFALFERSSRSVVLTAAGAALLPLADAAIDAITAVEEAAVGIRQGVRGRLRLGTIGATDDLLQQLLADVGRELPDLEIELVTSRVQESLRRVRDGELDAALVWDADAIPGTDVRELAMVPLLATVGDGHPLAASTMATIELRALAELPLALLHEDVDPVIWTRIHRWCEAAGFVPIVRSHDSVQNVLAAVGASSELWTIMPGDWPGPRLRQLPFDDPGIAGSIRLVTRSAQVGPAARAFARSIGGIAARSA